MRSILPLMLLLLTASVASAQFSLTPQVGLEQFKTNIRHNNGQSFSPLGGETTPKASLRMDYKFKKGHGPFAGIGTSPGVVAFSFNDPETALNNFQASTTKLQWRIEGGYQYTSKPFYFKKPKASASKTPPSNSVQRSYSSGRCGSSYRSQCGGGNRMAKQAAPVQAKNNNWNVRLQPSAGVAYIPGVENTMVTENSGTATKYQYNAGNWNTALITGLGFEFGKGTDRKLSLGVYYLKGLGNLQSQTVRSETAIKATDHTFKSTASSWSMTVGLPFTLAKKQKPVVQPKPETKHKEYKSKCGQQQYKRCTRNI